MKTSIIALLAAMAPMVAIASNSTLSCECGALSGDCSVAHDSPNAGHEAPLRLSLRLKAAGAPDPTEVELAVVEGQQSRWRSTTTHHFVTLGGDGKSMRATPFEVGLDVGVVPNRRKEGGVDLELCVVKRDLDEMAQYSLDGVQFEAPKMSTLFLRQLVSLPARGVAEVRLGDHALTAEVVGP